MKQIDLPHSFWEQAGTKINPLKLGVKLIVDHMGP